MRALAVSLVIAFHAWPHAVPGGYVGVDVFLVISGYLITGLLLRELETTGRVSLSTFYARRIRRLLPAASLALVGVAVAAVMWLPSASWLGLSGELVTASGYAENWLLMMRSVDYLTADDAPSAVQHFWSLSVEEQFYLFWPACLVLACKLAQRRAWNARHLFLVVLGLLSYASFCASLHYAAVDPAPGYFSTWSRLWELGVGGLLALAAAPTPSPRFAQLAGWLGLLAIGTSAYFYDSGLSFPGYFAVLPTFGAAALLWARVPGHSLIGQLLGNRVMQHIGDASYSLYLWHWPVFIVYSQITGRTLSAPADALTGLAFVCALAWAAKIAVEDPFRHGSSLRLRDSYALGASCTALVLACAGTLYALAPAAHVAAPLTASWEPDASHPGAAALAPGARAVPDQTIMPRPARARGDRGPAYAAPGHKTCVAPPQGTALDRCEFGDPTSEQHLVVLGDSHAVHWLPAFEVLAQQKRWHITALTKSACAFTDELIMLTRHAKPVKPYPECQEWARLALDWTIRQHPSLVVVSMQPFHSLPGMSSEQSQRAIASGTRRLTAQLLDRGIPVAVIRHTPWQEENVPVCMSGRHASVEACSSSRRRALSNSALSIATHLDRRLKLLDFTPFFCPSLLCPVVIGNVLVYRDAHHLTATYARSLADPLAAQLSKQFGL